MNFPGTGSAGLRPGFTERSRFSLDLQQLETLSETPGLAPNQSATTSALLCSLLRELHRFGTGKFGNPTRWLATRSKLQIMMKADYSLTIVSGSGALALVTLVAYTGLIKPVGFFPPPLPFFWGTHTTALTRELATSTTKGEPEFAALIVSKMWTDSGRVVFFFVVVFFLQNRIVEANEPASLACLALDAEFPPLRSGPRGGLEPQTQTPRPAVSCWRFANW